MNLTKTELELICEALRMAASRHESYGRFNPRSAKPHDDKAAAMRKLIQKIIADTTSRGSIRAMM
jgi:hypothetical protein